MAHFPGNTPTSWRRQLYGDLAHGVKYIHLYVFHIRAFVLLTRGIFTLSRGHPPRKSFLLSLWPLSRRPTIFFYFRTVHSVSYAHRSISFPGTHLRHRSPARPTTTSTLMVGSMKKSSGLRTRLAISTTFWLHHKRMQLASKLPSYLQRRAIFFLILMGRQAQQNGRSTSR
jgi:hypothetical protein